MGKVALESCLIHPSSLKLSRMCRKRSFTPAGGLLYDRRHVGREGEGSQAGGGGSWQLSVPASELGLMGSQVTGVMKEA